LQISESPQIAGPSLQDDRGVDLSIADECRLNVLWWHGSARGERALEVEVPSLSLTDGLKALYGQVDRVSLSELDALTSRSRLPFATGSFDLVTLYGHFPNRAALLELRRVLSSDGALLLAAGNRWWNGRWRGRTGTFPGRPTDLRGVSALGVAGFAHICPYWVEPTLALPRNLIPVARDRARQFEAFRAREWGGGTVRSMVVDLGFQSILYPGLVVVAKASESSNAGRR
jgi:SAM-dependent methyltransferase